MKPALPLPSRLPLHRSIAGKLAMMMAVTVALAIVFMYVASRVELKRAGRAALENRVDTDLAGLVDIHASGGDAELARRIRDRVAFNDPSAGAVYLFAAGPDHILAGNLTQWPSLDSTRSQIGEFTTPEGRRVLARSTQLGPSLRLVVGRDTRELDAMLSELTRAFMLAGALALLLALVVGYWLNRRLAARMTAIDELHDRAQRGEALPADAQPGKAGDELDVVAYKTQRMLARQEELVRLYRESSEHAAHEIRTPLMHLDQRLHRLLGQSADPRVEDAVTRGRQDIRSVVRLLESLLDISAARAHHGDVSDFARLDLSALVRDLVDIYSDSAEDKGLSLDARITPAIFVQGNEFQLQRLLTNLLDNAFKYCPQGSRIEVVLSEGPVLRVSDNGPGIAADIQPRLFDRFVKGANGVTGHGLGLALCRALAERHGFTLISETVPRGASFLLQPAEGRPG